MKLALNVTTTDGDTYQVETNLYVIVSYERKFKRKASDLAQSVGMEDLAFMAYESAKLSGRPVPIAFDDFIKGLDSIEVIDGEQSRPTNGGQ
jgi:hypothetical protein